MILCPHARLICQTLVANNMDTKKTYSELKDILPDDLTEQYIKDIKDGKIWTAISHYIFIKD